MNLIERYVQSVKSYLPTKMRDDVGEELGLLLNEKLDDMREEAKEKNGNGEVSEQVICDMLIRQGHPMKVAASYQEPSALISETLFPFYKQALKWTICILVGIKIFSWMISLLNGWDGNSIKDLLFDSVNTLLLSFAYVTLAFHFGGKLLEKQGLFDKWNPRNLPAMRTNWQSKPRSESIPSLIGTLVFLAFINGLTTFQAEHFSVTASVEFAALLPWANGIFFFSVIYDFEKIFRPLHTRVSTIFSLVITCSIMILLAYIAFLDSTIQVHFQDKIFEPSISHLWLIAMIIVFFVEGLPGSRRLLKMI